MNTFVMHLCAADRHERVDAVARFVGEDASGRFGILARHDRFMTTLTFGLARWKCATGDWEYLGLPGGLLYFRDDELRISTRRYLRDADPDRLARAVSLELLEEERALRTTRQTLHEIETEMLRRLTELEREPHRW